MGDTPRTPPAPGTPGALAIRARLLERMTEEDRGHTSPCWISANRKLRDGYTQTSYLGRRWMTHRLSWLMHHGPIPEGLTLDHLCRQTDCLNPDHLEPVTSRTNTLRGQTVAAAKAAQVECINGHPLEGANLYRRADRPNVRECRACRNEAARKHRERQRQAAPAA